MDNVDTDRKTSRLIQEFVFLCRKATSRQGYNGRYIIKLFITVINVTKKKD